ncbi:MAG: hypothetical protein KDJ50_06425 [Alphaproteobacteria bacterium]|nr:hypothetical protein [Alphaproteobacteria bacterium]
MKKINIGFLIALIGLFCGPIVWGVFETKNLEVAEYKKINFEQFNNIEELDSELKNLLPVGTKKESVQKLLVDSYRAFEGLSFFEDGNTRRYGRNQNGYSILY